MLPNLTLVIQGFAFFAVAWLVMKFGWPHIMAAIETRQQQIAEERGYKLQDHALSLYVVCNRPECQTKAGIGGHSHHHG